MNEELQAHKTSDKIKWILTLIAFVVIGVMLTGIIAGWFDKKDVNKEPEQPAVIAQRNITLKSSLSVTDDKAAFDAAIERWSNDNSYREDNGSDDDGEYYTDYSAYKFTRVTCRDRDGVTSKIIDSNLFKITCNLDDKVYFLDELGINYALLCKGDLDQDGYESYSYYLLLPTGNIFSKYSSYEVGGISGIGSGSSFGYLENYSMHSFASNTIHNDRYSCNVPSEVAINYTLVPAIVPLPDDPVKEGYTFIGWYLDEALTLPYDNRPLYEDTQLYAKFEINRYTVTLDSDNGSEAKSKTVEWNTVLTLTEPERTGYNFLG